MVGGTGGGARGGGPCSEVGRANPGRLLWGGAWGLARRAGVQGMLGGDRQGGFQPVPRSSCRSAVCSLGGR